MQAEAEEREGSALQVMSPNAAAARRDPLLRAEAAYGAVEGCRMV